MSDRYEEIRAELAAAPRTWVVTGAAGFIGSHLVEALLGLGQRVVGLDDFSTGRRRNLREAVDANAGSRARFRLIRADVRDAAACRAACAGAHHVLHQAAVASVPRSVADPLETYAVNLGGTLNVLQAARAEGVGRVVYASSSAVYGDLRAVPHREERLGAPLSPYALSKRDAEAWAALFARLYGTEAVGLRYFNVFGPRQDPEGPYAAVVPAWTRALLRGEPCVVHGDGGATRDFVPVADVVRANLLAAVAALPGEARVFNVGAGRATSLEALFALLRDAVAELRPEVRFAAAVHDAAREGDVRDSRADLSRITAALGYRPTGDLFPALRETVRWHAARLRGAAARVG